jgi:hypothetical protein
VRCSSVIYYCLLGGLILNAVYTFFYQRDLELIVTEDAHGWYTKLNFIGDLLISVAAILSHYKYRNQFPKFVIISYWLLLFLVVVANWGTYSIYFTSPASFYNTKGIGTYLNLGILFAAANLRYISKIQKLFLLITITFTVLGLMSLASVGMGFNRQDMLFKVREYANYLVYVFPFFFLRHREKKWQNILYYVFFVGVLVIILSTASRSYIIVFFLVLAAKLYYQFSHSIRENAYLLLALVIIFTFGINYLMESSFYNSFSSIIDIIEERAADDTRSEQFEEFFRQYDASNLLFGVGPSGTYYSSNVGGQYGSFDNQFILLGWWAGLPALLVYILLLVRSMLRTYSPQRSFPDKESVKMAKWCIFLWILAAGGLAIWVSISSHLYNYFDSLCIGLATFRAKKRFNLPAAGEYQAA